MARIRGGAKNKKSGTPWTKEELLEVYFLYKKLNGQGLHERNLDIIKLAQSLGRTVRSTEAQTLMFRNLDRGGEYSHGNMNKLSKTIWREREEPAFTGIVENPPGKEKGESKDYPAGLLKWAGHRKGGVKKPFNNTGRPTGDIIHTKLTSKIDEWVKDLSEESPRVILLIGGPGNGKTDALEYLVSRLDDRFGSRYYDEIFKKIKEAGNIAPRTIEVDLDPKFFGRKKLKLVQDASTGKQGLTSGECLIEDIEDVLKDDSVYIAGINRGILAEAVSKPGLKPQVYEILNGIVQGLTQFIDPKPLWPLGSKLPFSQFSVWPMDVESLVSVEDNLEATPAYQVISDAISDDNWNCESCSIKDYCPFYQNKNALQDKGKISGLLQILSDYEVIANKRWSFRELFSLFSYIIVGTEQEFNGYQSPCHWAEKQASNLNSTSLKKRIHSTWNLNDHLYSSRLFSKWPTFNSVGRVNIKTNKEIAGILNSSPITREFFGYFSFVRTRNVYRPDIAKLIENNFFGAMDPSQLSNEENDFNKLMFTVRKIESSFSYSVRSGYEQIKNSLNPLQKLLFEQLIEMEEELDTQIRFEPSISSMRIDYLLGLIRSIATRYLKRIHFTSNGISKDEIYLQKYRALTPVSDPGGVHLKRAKELFDNLVQEQSGLRVVLNSSISQPQLDQDLQISLKVRRVKIKHQYIKDKIIDVPRPAVKVFNIKFRNGSFSVPLTYQLYKALYLVQEGVRLASLPTAVISMLDGIKSKMAGEIVRDPGILEDAKLQIGSSNGYYRIDEAESEIEITPQN